MKNNVSLMGNYNINNFLGLSECKNDDFLIYKNGFWINSAITFGRSRTSGSSGR